MNNEENDFENIVKIGTFQLQTKSFWFGVIAILSVFLFTIIWLNTFYWYKITKDINEVNKQLIQKIESVHLSTTSK